MKIDKRIESLETAARAADPLTPAELHRLVDAATDTDELSDEVLVGIVNESLGRPLDTPISDEELAEITRAGDPACEAAEKAIDALIASSRRIP